MKMLKWIAITIVTILVFGAIIYYFTGQEEIIEPPGTTYISTIAFFELDTKGDSEVEIVMVAFAVEGKNTPRFLLEIRLAGYYEVFMDGKKIFSDGVTSWDVNSTPNGDPRWISETQTTSSNNPVIKITRLESPSQIRTEQSIVFPLGEN